MGMSASQVRFLSLQSRKNSIGRQLLTLSNRKMALSRDMNTVALRYNNALNQTTLKWSNDSGSTYNALSYDLMMKPNDLNTEKPYIVTKAGLSDVANDFISFIMSKDGQAVVTEEKYISVSNEEFKSTMPEGKITVAGSSSVTPLMEALKEAYLKVNKNATIDIQQNDSTTGVNSAIEGICDIGMASRELKDTEVAGGVKSTAIAMDGIAVIVNKDNAVDDLTSDQVKSIFTGETTTWDKVK